MEDWNVKLPYTSPECKDQYCTYSYKSWCLSCENGLSRRRSRSETNEYCKKRSRDFRTLTPKKYKCNEYENMEVEYDYKGWHESKPDCCRVRSNLVELPTSYISNNCQMPPIHQQSMSKNDVDCFKPFCADRPTIFENLESMDSKNNGRSKISPHKLDQPTNPLRSKGSPLYYTEGGTRITGSNCQDFCPYVGLRSHDVPTRKPLCFTTETYFNRPIDKEKYSKEVEYLKEKLKILHNSVYTNHPNPVGVSIVNLDAERGDGLQNIATSIEIKPKVLKKSLSTQTPLVKTSKSKVSLKIRKANQGIKSKKVKSKNGISENPLSVDSGSESDSVEDDSLDEDPPSASSSDPISTDDSTKDSLDVIASLAICQPGTDGVASWPIRSSLFPNIPPYIKFSSHELETPFKLPAGKKYFKWKLSTITPIIVRKTLTNSGFALIRKSNQWLGTWGKHMKSPMFKTLKDTQKLNHFPGTFHLGRKDRLWRNFQKMIAKYGMKEFGFLPHTYVLPQELKLLKQNWDFKDGKDMWIIKPPASARGVGIKVINKWSQLPKKTSLVCQKYVNNPYLINGSKFDLRLYVLVTSFHPLRIYLYPDGLARFASVKYSDDVKDLKDRYMHLTNYSINKLSSQYTSNEDANACHGHKWTLSKLMEYLHKEGVDTKSLWKNLQQLVIKTIISCEPFITPLCEDNMNSYYNCYELFGVDVLLDEHLKPWLLEVNISPSLHSASPLDAHVKGPLVQTLFDMAQFHLPAKLADYVKTAPQCFDNRIYARAFTKKERSKHTSFTQFDSRGDYVYDILKELTGDDVRQLIRAEDEYVVKGKFERIFPTANTFKYLDFMEPRYYNRLFDAWETKYSNRREDGIALLQTLCAQKVHLKIGNVPSLSKSFQATSHGQTAATAVAPSMEGQTHLPIMPPLHIEFLANKLSTLNEEVRV
ncbi:tubulin monoglutamylase TTLL4-like isoform X2 [Anthonomus grandis grandis]|uniref:tubulin monoglutamylase TTLL4-like isoform X2 n=1 Tax=Anthonomus grandis grandis TaxID=2921223 RepID=UPI0021666892|nr:tubulin monoglutamylase TTLL4-like isoform X2 [Anthonomus grandis grandis]